VALHGVAVRHLYSVPPAVLVLSGMDGNTGGLSRGRKNAIRLAAFLVTFLAIVVIPMGVMYGGLGPGWMMVSNVLFVLILAAIAAGAVAWVWMRVRRLVRR